MSSTTRATWKYAEYAKAFHARHGYAPYTMTPNSVLETEMLDRNLPPQWRILSGVRRFSSGNLSEIAVDEMPKPDPSILTPEPASSKMGMRPDW